MLHRRYSTGSRYASCFYSGIAKLFSFAKQVTALNCRLFCIIWKNEEKKHFKVLYKNNILESRTSCLCKPFFSEYKPFLPKQFVGWSCISLSKDCCFVESHLSVLLCLFNLSMTNVLFFIHPENRNAPFFWGYRKRNNWSEVN